MFGYVMINKGDLKVRELETYQSFYCGLCQKLKERYGLSGQLTLSYDLTFVVMLATAVMVSALTTQIKWQEQIRLEVEKEKTRANLLRAVSHDIRTPLTSIQASASGILDNYDALGRQEKVELLEGIRDESRWLIRMVENLLSITRINGDRAQLQTTWEVVEEVVGGAVGKPQKYEYPFKNCRNGCCSAWRITERELIRRFCRLFSKDSFRPAIMLRAMENGAWGSDYRSA